MGKTQSTGNLTNALAQDSSNNIGIGGAVNASFKLQVTGATNLTSDLTVNGLTVGRGAGAIVSNTAVGLSALPVNTTGTLNTAIGNLALLTNTTGYGNTSVGYGAIGYNTTGFFNAAIGVNALLFNSTGTYNNALGTAALYANTTGSYNTAVGQQAGTANTTGSNNTYIGYSSGFNITTGSNNTIIGRYFGTAAMANNIVLADGAGNVRYQWDGTNNQFNGATQFNSNVSINTGGQASLSIISSAGNSSEILSYVSGVLKSTISTSATEFKLISAIDNILKFQSSTNFRASLIFSNSADYSYTFPSATGTLALTSNLSAYLPLTGGTLTGALSGTSATFSSSVTASNFLTNGAGGAGGQEALRINNDNGYIGFFNGSNTTRSGYLQGNTTDVTLTTSLSTPLIFGTANVEKMRITSGGNVGIGTSSPNSLLQVGNFSNNSILTLGADASSVSSVYFGDGTGAALYRGFVEYAHETDTMRIGTSSAERMIITSGGNVGIGTSTPVNYGTRNFEVNGGSGSAYVVVRGGSNSIIGEIIADGAIYVSSKTAHPLIFRTTDVERMRITSDGRFLVGATATDSGCKFRFVFNGITQNGLQLFDETNNTPSCIFHLFGINNPTPINIGAILRASNTNAVIFSTTSDYRLKEDYKEIKGLEKVSQIKVYDFKWKGLDSRMDGVIAHELAEVLPYAVHGEKDGLDKDGKEFYQGVDYSKIVPVLIKSIQELQAKIVTLESKLN